MTWLLEVWLYSWLWWTTLSIIGLAVVIGAAYLNYISTQKYPN